MFEAQGKSYQCCDRPVLLYYCKMWELKVVDELQVD